jgi:protein-S-isoprenylcysteine O-methyltransferase Ste14
MALLERLPIPKRLSSRVWLVSLPSALVSFERRQGVPKLPLGTLRYLGIPLIAAGVALAVWAWRTPGARIAYNGPLSHLARRPATAGGILVLAGTSLFLRSVVLAAYSAGLVLISTSDRIEIDEPNLESFMGRGG